jgi:hypothetical protein
MAGAWLLAAVAVRMLALPAHATIDPFGTRSLMAVSQEGSIVATVTIRGYVQRVALWRGAASHPVVLRGTAAVAGFDGGDALLINADRPERIAGGRSLPIDMRFCEDFPQSSLGPVVAGALTDGALIATMRSPSIVDLDDMSGQYAPVVLYVRGASCLNAGNGVALGTAGLYTAGYAGFLGSVPAPSNVISAHERFVALRWRQRTMQMLSPGVAIAVNASGTAVGADAPPGNGVRFGSAPHALLWPAGNNAPVALAPESAVSAAYAVDDRGDVTGMLESQGRHYAFLWRNGSLQRLDDLIRAPGWRFECGYAFAGDDRIVGIGTYRGRAAAFEISGI